MLRAPLFCVVEQINATVLYVIVTEPKKHLPIQTLQNVHNTNIVPNSQTRQIRNAFKTICAPAFFEKIILHNTFLCVGNKTPHILTETCTLEPYLYLRGMYDLFEQPDIKSQKVLNLKNSIRIASFLQKRI